MNTACSEATGAIYANDCGIIAGQTGFDGGPYCGTTWSDGASISCNDDGSINTVHTSGGDFGNCVDATQFGNTDCSLAPEGYYFVDYCCSPV